MKTKLLRIILMITALFAAFIVISGALEINVDEDVMVVGYDNDVDYMQEIVQALEDGSGYAVYMASIYEAQRNLKIESLGLDVQQTDFFTKGNDAAAILKEVKAYIGEGDSGYELTEAERKVVEAAVMAEAGGEAFDGQMMIAQCILDGSQRAKVDVLTFIKNSQIVTSAKEPYASCKKAVTAVFDLGQRVTAEKADIWYAPALCQSAWHESQIFVTTLGSHKFFRKINV